MIRAIFEGRSSARACVPAILKEEQKSRAGTVRGKPTINASDTDRRRETKPRSQRSHRPEFAAGAFALILLDASGGIQPGENKPGGWWEVKTGKWARLIQRWMSHPPREQSCEGPEESHERRRTKKEGRTTRPARPRRLELAVAEHRAKNATVHDRPGRRTKRSGGA